MPVFDSSKVPASERLREWWYNSLDSAVTLEIMEGLAPIDQGSLIYAFERSMQGPALDMMLTGFRIDRFWQNRSLDMLQKKIDAYEEALNRLSFAVWQKPLNPRSPKQKMEFFYEALRLPVQYKYAKGEKKVSTDRDSLEKLDVYYIAQPFINLLLEVQDASKLRGTLKTAVDPDGRMRCAYNVCGTETGRWNSKQSAFGTGTNLMNITEELRRMFVADPGHILVSIDGEQAESRYVGFIQGVRNNAWEYLDACEAGDLHTAVAELVWPELGWSHDTAENKAIAARRFYRHFTYRDMAKRGGHLTNYYGTDWTMGKSLKIPQPLATEFQRRYARGPAPAFPGFKKWWQWCSMHLIQHQKLTTLLGRERTFFGRPNDDSTLREFIAFEPQGSVGDLINEGGRRVWERFPGLVQVLGQCYDSYMFQIPESRLDLLPSMLSAFEVPVTSPTGRRMVIPSEAKLGWNWASNEQQKKPEDRLFADGNPDGLIKWKPGTDYSQRRRLERPEAGVLDRVIC